MTISFIFFLFFREDKSWHFMWIICLADDSHYADDSHNVKTCFLRKKKWKKKKKMKKCCLLQILLGALRVKLEKTKQNKKKKWPVSSKSRQKKPNWILKAKCDFGSKFWISKWDIKTSLTTYLDNKDRSYCGFVCPCPLSALFVFDI